MTVMETSARNLKYNENDLEIAIISMCAFKILQLKFDIDFLLSVCLIYLTGRVN